MDPIDWYRSNDVPFARFLGIEVASAVPERVTGSMVVRPELCTVQAVAHGGAVVAFADTLGALATVGNLPQVSRIGIYRPLQSRRNQAS